MLKINTWKDIQTVKEQKLLPEVLLEELEPYFKELVESFTGEEIWNTFSLEDDGRYVRAVWEVG